MMQEIGILGLETVGLTLLIAPTLNAASRLLEVWYRGKSELAATNAHLTEELETSKKANAEFMSLHQSDEAKIGALSLRNLEVEERLTAVTDELHEEQKEHSVTSDQLSTAVDQLNTARKSIEILESKLENEAKLVEERSEELALAKGDAAYFQSLMDYYQGIALQYRAELTQQEEESIQGWFAELRRTIKESIMLHSVP